MHRALLRQALHRSAVVVQEARQSCGPVSAHLETNTAAGQVPNLPVEARAASTLEHN
jgi:hypothetical protein